MKERRRLSVALVVLVLAALLCYQVVYSVRIDQVAAHYRFGKVKKVIRPDLDQVATGAEAIEKIHPSGVPLVQRAGWKFKVPIIDRIRRFDQRIQHVDGPLTQLQLPDENQIVPRVYATWRISDPVAFEKTLMGDVRTARETLKEIIGGRTPEVFGRHSLEEIVNTDESQLRFAEIERELYEEVKAGVESAEKSYGIEICSLGITWVALPEDATRAVFGRMEQERRTEAEKLTEEGKRIRRTTIAAAQEQRDKILAEAEAEAKRIRAVGEAEAASYYDTFARDQELAIFLRRLEAFRMMAQNAYNRDKPITFVLSTETEPFGILKRGPLDRGLDLEMPETPQPPQQAAAEGEVSADAAGDQ